MSIEREEKYSPASRPPTTARHDRPGAAITVSATLWLLACSGLVTGLVITALGGWTEGDPATAIMLGAIAAAYATVGLVVVIKIPGNHIGWNFLIASVLVAIWIVALTYSDAGLASGWPGLGYAVWLQQAIYFPMILSLVSVPLLIFPDGRVPSPSWRWVWVLIVGTSIVALVVPSITPEFIWEHGDMSRAVPNPWGGIEGTATALDSTPIGAFGATLVGASLLAPAAAMIYRFRRSNGIERLQLKWLAYAATLAGVGLALFYPLEGFTSDLPTLVDALAVVALLGVLAIPIATGVAVVRYRLYDIDRLIKRTISYGLLVTVLVAVYAIGVFAVGSLPFESGFPVAVSTLAVAAMFNPLRHRLQAAIDRRFARSGYDFQQVVDHFSNRVRDQVDIDSLVDELLEVVDDTVVPANATVWMPQPSRSR